MGVVNWTKLPVLTERVLDIQQLDSTKQISFKGNVSILCFVGNDIEMAKGGVFNVNQKIYKDFYGYQAFQAVAIYPISRQSQITELQKKLGQFTDMTKWKFVGLSNKQVTTLFKSLNTNKTLTDGYSNLIFIIDKDLKLRGRKNDSNKSTDLLYGYNMNSVGELGDKMKMMLKYYSMNIELSLKTRKRPIEKKLNYES